MSYSIAGRSKSSFFFPLNPHSFKLCLYLGVYRLYRAALLTLDLNYQPLNWRRKWQPAPVFLPGESRDGGAWWAVVSGVAQSWTRLKQLSSSSSSSSPLYIYVPQLLYPFICQYTSRLPPCSHYFKQCCIEHLGTCVFFSFYFLWVYA